jgi:hypothetical protein
VNDDLSFKDTNKTFFKGAGWVIWFGALGLVVILIFSAMALFGFGLFSQKTANFRGETAKRNQVEGSGEFRRTAYDHFFDLCTQIQGKEALLKSSKEQLNATTDDQLKSRIQTNITALTGQRLQQIAQYNNDANKSYTVGQFRSNALPYHLDPSSEATTCEL